MAEVQTPEVQAPVAPAAGKKGPATHEQKQKRRKLIRRCITLVVVAAVAIGGWYLLKKFVFKDNEDTIGEPMTQTVFRGSIQSTVTGMGNARAKNSAVVTPDAGYTVLELFVNEGDTVEEGQLLYNLDDSAAQEAVQSAQTNVLKAQEAVDDLNRELEKLYEDVANLNITAPHAGKLSGVKTGVGAIKVGDDLGEGTVIATIINDTKLRLHLYYSWAYEGQIQVGQQAKVSVPSAMADYPATVEQVNYVRRIVPEGSVTFEVVFVMDNPGTLTEGVTASATLTGVDGSPVYPYENGTLEYFETTELTAKVAGPVEYVNLMNYAAVEAGQSLVKLGDKEQQAKIASKRTSIREQQKSVDDALEALEEAQKKLDNYHAVSPIAGRILSLGGLAIGQEVSSGAQIQIADTSTMMIDISIDERNVGFVSTGMGVDIQDMMGNYYYGTVETVALTAKSENGVASFPATVVVDNPEGNLMSGSYVDYTFIASQSDGCLVVPIQAVKNVSLAHLQSNEGDMMGGMDDTSGMLPVDDTVTLPQDDSQAGGDLSLPVDDSQVGDDVSTPEDGVQVDGVAVLPEDSITVLPAGDTLDDGSVVIPEDAIPEAIAISRPVGGMVIMGGSSMGPSAFAGKGDTATVCFVKGEDTEGRGIEPDPSWEMPEGFFAVLVETGLNDESNVEIKSGLMEGDEVFIGYMTNSAWG